MQNPLSSAWYEYSSPGQRKLIETAWLLVEEAKTSSQKHDYSYVLFPLAKAYEGFLKQYLFDAELIDEPTYNSRKFRIGRALNPDVSYSQRDKNWLFDDLGRVCGIEMARKLWETWLDCRNQVFHFFPQHQQYLTLVQAQDRMEMIADAMETALACRSQWNKIFKQNQVDRNQYYS